MGSDESTKQHYFNNLQTLTGKSQHNENINVTGQDMYRLGPHHRGVYQEERLHKNRNKKISK